VSVVRKKKRTLFGKILQKVVRRIESELSSQEERTFSSDVPLDDSCECVSDADTIQTRRNELRTAKHDSSDLIITFEGEN